jgi:hypothetical protein
MTIRSRVPTDEYRENWERVFGKKPKHDANWDDCVEVGGVSIPLPRLNPHDADEHPSAD